MPKSGLSYRLIIDDEEKKSENSSVNFAKVPQPVRLHIASFLNISDWRNLSLTNNSIFGNVLSKMIVDPSALKSALTYELNSALSFLQNEDNKVRASRALDRKLRQLRNNDTLQTVGLLLMLGGLLSESFIKGIPFSENTDISDYISLRIVASTLALMVARKVGWSFISFCIDAAIADYSPGFSVFYASEGNRLTDISINVIQRRNPSLYVALSRYFNKEFAHNMLVSEVIDELNSDINERRGYHYRRRL